MKTKKKGTEVREVRDIEIPTRMLRAVSEWAHSKAEQPHIHMVKFGNGEYVATDGHRIVRVPLEYDGPPFGIDRDHLKIVTAAAPDDARSIRLQLQGQWVELGFSGFSGFSVTMRVPARDAKTFPKIDMMLPKPEKSPPSKLPDPYGMNPGYLAAVHEVITASGSGAGVRITGWGGELDAMTFESSDYCATANSYGKIRFVIMPTRTNAKG